MHGLSGGKVASCVDGRRSADAPAPGVPCNGGGRLPASNSYSTTPSEYTSLRVSTEAGSVPACSGLM